MIDFKTKNHGIAYRSFSKWLGHDATVADLTYEKIDEFCESGFLKILPRSIVSYRSALHGLAKSVGFVPPGIITEVPESEGELTLWGLFEKHYRPRRLIGKSPETTRLYNTTVRKFSRWLRHSAKLSDLTDEKVACYLDWLTGQQAMASVVKEYDQLMALWRFASRRKLVDTYPDLMRPIAPKPIPDAFSVEEMNRLVAAARAWDGEYFEVPAGLWWEALIRLVYDSGERVGALLKMEPCHLQNEWVLIPAQSRKGSQQGKRFRVGEPTQIMLAKIAALQTEPRLFAWPRTYTYFWQTFTRIVDAAGLPTDRRGKFHKIRRTVATFYEAKGGNATVLLGHSSRRVTEAYLDQRYIQTPQPCELIQPLDCQEPE